RLAAMGCRRIKGTQVEPVTTTDHREHQVDARLSAGEINPGGSPAGGGERLFRPLVVVEDEGHAEDARRGTASSHRGENLIDGNMPAAEHGENGPVDLAEEPAGIHFRVGGQA